MMTIFEKIQQRCGENKRPVNELVDEIKRLQEQGAIQRANEIRDMNKNQQLKNLLGRSGIELRHKNCSFDNFEAPTEPMKNALNQARLFAEFFIPESSFIFHGNPGTGKNHLAAAIANKLIERGRTAVIITATELVDSLRSARDRGKRTRDVMNYFCSCDLLVIDELGRSKGKQLEWEQNYIDEIVDKRSKRMKATGLISNLDLDSISQLVGYRVISRLSEDKPVIVEFDWDDYRSRARG